MRRFVVLSLIAAVMAGCGGDGETATYEVPVTLEDPNPPPELAFAGLPDDVRISPQACSAIEALEPPTMIESSPEEINALADRYAAIGDADPQLDVAGAAAAHGLRRAADAGADLKALLAIWDDTPTSTAIRDLAMAAFADCAVSYPEQLPLGAADRIIDVAQHLHPDHDFEPVQSWAKSVTGEPPTIYWSFGYLGHDAVLTCDLIASTLVEVGYSGTFISLHDGGTGPPSADGEIEFVDLAEGKAGDGCDEAEPDS